MTPDRLGNLRAVEGCTRCGCGCKYWENDRCVDCGSNAPTHVLEPDDYPIVRMGARWVCDGPFGRFHARTKRDAERMLTENGGRLP